MFNSTVVLELHGLPACTMRTYALVWRSARHHMHRSPSKPTEFVNSLCASNCYVNAQHTSYTDDELICQLVAGGN